MFPQNSSQILQDLSDGSFSWKKKNGEATRDK